MIKATFPASTVLAAGSDPGSRTIAGIAVPYGVEGIVSSGETVVFEPGSLDAAARPVALRDHDRGRVVGKVNAAEDRGQHMTASVKVSRTPLGDEALTLAADGLLMFSVGADPTDYHYDDAGTLRVHAAAWNELSLLSFGAYAGARVTEVTAAKNGDPPMSTLEELLSDTPDPETQPPPEPDDDEPIEPVEDPQAELLPVVVRAGSAIRPSPRHPANPYADLDIRRFSQILAGAYNGSLDPGKARQMIRGAIEQTARVTAALANVTLVGTNNIGPAYRPAYQPELVEMIQHGRPQIQVLRQGTLERGDFPNKTFNTWATAPTVGAQATEKTAVTSTAVKITATSVPVQTWAGANDLSQQVLDFGSPSFIEDYIRAATVSFNNLSDTYAVNTLLAAAIVTTPGAVAAFLANVAALLASLSPGQVPQGKLWLGLSWDVFVASAGITQQNGPAFWEGHLDLSNYLPSETLGGMQVFVDPNYPVKTMMIGLTNAATWYEMAGTPATLRVADVNLLGLDVGVYGYGALGVQYPLALAKMTCT